MRVEHKPDQGRFEIFDGPTLAGISEYAEADGIRNFNHTVTFPEFRGRGVAATITEFALNDTRDAGMHVEASCWFVRDFIKASGRYDDLIPK